MNKRALPKSPAISIPPPSSQKPDSSDKITSVIMLEMKAMFDELKKQQKAEFQNLNTVVRDLKTQNAEIQKSIEFLSTKYDDVVLEMKSLKNDIVKNREYVTQLELKVEHLERNALLNVIEMRNIPKKTSESKSSLMQIVQKAAEKINCTIEKSDIRNVFRQKKKTESQSPIVIEFSANVKKEEFIKLIRDHNKINNTDKLNTTHLDVAGPAKPVYVGEHLTYKTNRLFFLARELAKDHNYSHCWTYNGHVYLRKTDGAPPMRIVNEDDINKLRNDDPVHEIKMDEAPPKTTTKLNIEKNASRIRNVK